MIKISSGIYRSRQIQTPNQDTIPTKNRVREAMMSMVYPYLNGANVLDLFAGSGALGIEALSRGAAKATLVDASLEAWNVIRENLRTLKETRATLIHADYLQAIAGFKEPFDLVFLDPPYALKESYQNSINALLSKGLLSEECAIVLEYEGELDIDSSAFASRRDYTYGKTKVILLRDLL